ncbi:MAG: hypothetical protein ACYTG5_20955, partial [Planctomycetota bacterium]
MERRFTAFLIPALVAVLAIMIFGPEPEEQGQPASPGLSEPAPDSTRDASNRGLAGAPAQPAVETGSNRQERAEQQGPTAFTRDFGVPGESGFRIRFDRRGAAIRQVTLLDHFDDPGNGDEERTDFYSLVEEEVGISRGEQTSYHWFYLKFDAGSAASRHDIDLSLVPWQLADPNANPLVFTLPLDEGLVLERSYEYEPGRRDLKLRLALRAVGDEAHVDQGKLYKLQLMGLGVRSPTEEYVLGGNPARAMAAEQSAVDQTLTTFAVAASTQVGKQPMVDRSTNKTIAFAGSTNRFFG